MALIPIQIAVAFARLGKRLQAIALPSRQMMTDIISVVTSIDPLLKTLNFAQASNSLVPGTYANYFTVPAGKRWVVSFWEHGGTVGSTRKSIRRGATVAPYGASGTAGELLRNINLILDAGDELLLDSTGNAADTSIRSSVLYEEEDWPI